MTTNLTLQSAQAKFVDTQAKFKSLDERRAPLSSVFLYLLSRSNFVGYERSSIEL
ncbi:hypothetical protein THF5H11_10606 [Vibrio jasicida]|nr:hypothetical protein THF5H11_10606 [Vibrio jasicida]